MQAAKSNLLETAAEKTAAAFEKRGSAVSKLMEDEKKMEGGMAADTAESRASAAAKPVMSESDRRRARAAAKLKENLSRRKQQVRARRAGEADETDGLPAAKMDEL